MIGEAAFEAKNKENIQKIEGDIFIEITILEAFKLIIKSTKFINNIGKMNNCDDFVSIVEENRLLISKLLEPNTSENIK
jgi:hypothetical protein